MSSSTNNHPSDNNNNGGGGNNSNNNGNNSNNNNNPYRRSKSDPQDVSSNATSGSSSATGTGTDATAAVSTSLLLPSMASGGTNDDHLPLMPHGTADGPYSFNIEDMSLIALLSRVNSLSSLQPPSLSSSSSFPPPLLPPPLFPTLLDEAVLSRRTSQLPSYRNNGEEFPNDESSSSLSTSMRTSTTGSTVTSSGSIPSESQPQSPPTATMSQQEHQLTLLRSILDMATMIGSGTTTEVSPRRTRTNNHNDYDMRPSSSHNGNSHGKQHRRRNSFPPRQ